MGGVEPGEQNAVTSRTSNDQAYGGGFVRLEAVKIVGTAWNLKMQNV